MDVGRQEHRRELAVRHLLFGVVTYAAGRLGAEPVRSQGHVHKVAGHSGWSPPELYEVWSGRAIVYMQERAAGDPGRCFAIEAGPGEVIVVPPGWAHATVSALPSEPMTFGAWCDRDYGFEYDEVRARGGLAYFPLLAAGGSIRWERNPRYASPPLVERRARPYPSWGSWPVSQSTARSPATRTRCSGSLTRPASRTRGQASNHDEVASSPGARARRAPRRQGVPMRARLGNVFADYPVSSPELRPSTAQA